jgi:hypothetical protein
MSLQDLSAAFLVAEAYISIVSINIQSIYEKKSYTQQLTK